jgi:hypothetical protein
MSYLRINVDNEGKEFVEQLLLKLGYDVVEEPRERAPKRKSSKVSPTFLYGKWKNVDIDPATYRKSLWARGK